MAYVSKQVITSEMKIQKESNEPNGAYGFSRASIPESIDWRTRGVVNPIKNQGHCGSCSTFSAVSSLESAIAIQSGKLPYLSEQHLVDCA